MQENQRLALGILLALLLVVFVILAGMTAMAEGFQPRVENIPTNTASPQPTQPPAGLDESQSPTATLITTNVPNVSAPTETHTATFTPIAGGCTYPAGWKPITLVVGDSLAGVAATYNTSVDQLITGNCLFGEGVQPGTLLYVPASGVASSTAQAIQNPTQTSTSVVITCGASASWTTYRIISGDTLFSLAHAYGTTVSQLQYANCMGSSTNIVIGNKLSVPTVSKTNTPLAGTATSTLTSTPTPSNTPTSSNTPTPSPTPTIDETGTAVASTATAIAVIDIALTAAVPPTLNIVAPGTGATGSTTVIFTGTASDAVDGDISSSITWSSDQDGILGTEASIKVTIAGGVTHVITASVTDSAGIITTQTVTITVP